jgi:hypothetical protein
VTLFLARAASGWVVVFFETGDEVETAQIGGGSRGGGGSFKIP